MRVVQITPAPLPVVNFATTQRKRTTAVTRLCAKLSSASVAYKAACLKYGAAESDGVTSERKMGRLQRDMNRAMDRESDLAVRLVAEPSKNGGDLLAKLEAYRANTDLFSDGGDEYDLARSGVEDLTRFGRVVDLSLLVVPQ